MAYSQTEILSNKDNLLFYRFFTKLKSELSVIFCLLALLFIFRYTAVLNIDKYYLGSVQGDAGLYVWLLKTNLRDLVSLNWFDKPAFYPYSQVLAWSDNFILPSVVAAPLFKLGLSEPLVFNIIILLATFLNGYFTYRLFYHLSGELFAAFFAGSVFMTLPYFTHQLGHPQLIFFFFIPLAIDFMVLFINRPEIKNAFKLSAVIYCAYLTTVSYAIFASLICLIILLCVKILRPGRLDYKILKPLIPAAIVSLVLLLPFILPYLHVKNAFGERQIYEAYYFSANILSYLSSTPYNLLYAATQSLSHSEAHLFPGLSLCILAILALGRLTEASKLRDSINLFLLSLICAVGLTLLPQANILRLLTSILIWLSLIQALRILYILGSLERKLSVNSITARSLIAIFGTIGLVFFSISFGPLGNPEKGQLAVAPYSFFYTLFPGFSSIRAISRAGAVVLFCLCMLSALFISIIYKKRAIRGVSVIALMFCLLENVSTSYPLSALPLRPDNIHNLANLNTKEAAMILPFTGELDSNNEVISWSEYAKLNITSMLWATEANTFLVNGYSGQKTKLMRDFPRELKEFPNQRSLNSLGSIAGLRYVIYVPDFTAGFKQEDFEKKAAAFSSQLKLLSLDAQGTYLFEISPELQNLSNKPVLVPPGAAYKLNFEIRTAFKQDKEKIQISAAQSGTSKVLNFEINADGSWSSREIKLEKIKENVKPSSVTFTSEDSALVIKNLRISE